MQTDPGLEMLMKEQTRSIYDWTQPQLPEDPAFYRSDDTVMLVSRPVNNFRKTFEFGEDRIRRGGPREGGGGHIVVVHKGVNAGNQLAHLLKRAAADRALGNHAEPALHLVEPRCIGRREMQMIPWPPGEPRADVRMFVRTVVVDDQMNVELRRHVGVNVLEEREKLLVAMARLALRQDLAGRDIERGEQRGRPMAEIAMGDAFDIAEPQRQDRPRALQRLNLAFLIDTEDQGGLGRIEVEPDNIADLLHKERIGRQGKAGRAMRLDAEQGEVPLHRALANAGFGRHRADTPVGAAIRRGRLQDRPQQRRDAVVIMGARPTTARRVIQPRQPVVLKPPPPMTHHRVTQADALGHRRIGQPVGRKEDRLRPLHQGMRQRPRMGPFSKLRPLQRRQGERKGARTTNRHSGSGKDTAKPTARIMRITNGTSH